jgi:hypothetical protein
MPSDEDDKNSPWDDFPHKVVQGSTGSAVPAFIWAWALGGICAHMARESRVSTPSPHPLSSVPHPSL